MCDSSTGSMDSDGPCTTFTLATTPHIRAGTQANIPAPDSFVPVTSPDSVTTSRTQGCVTVRLVPVASPPVASDTALTTSK